MLNRRQLLVSGGVGVALSTAGWGQIHKVALPSRRLSLDLNGLSYWYGFCPFLNWQKTADVPNLELTDGRNPWGKAAFDAGVYINPETGEIANPVPPDLLRFHRIFYARPGQGNFAGGYDFAG